MSSSKGVSEDQLLVYGAYTQVNANLQHHNHIQMTYRTFISTWLLATYVGIGYTVSSFEINLPFHPFTTIAFICLASSMGIFLVWYLDLIVCEQQIAASVFEGVSLEEKYSWLPRFYHNIKSMRGLISYVNLKCIFYIGCLMMLTITAGVALTLLVHLKHPSYCCLVPIITIILMLITSYLLLLSTKRTDPYSRIQKMHGENLG